MTAAIAQRIGFIGAGRMAQALASGFVRGGLLSAEQIVAADPSADATNEFSRLVPGARVADDNNSVLANADIAFVAVKPQFIEAVAAELNTNNFSGTLVSIVAGVPIARLGKLFSHERIVRVMPNTPALVGSGAAGFSCSPAVEKADREVVAQLLGAVGVAFELDEKLLDAVTGLSGSGPAFVYMMIEALSDGGVRMGLPRTVAAQLAAQTVRGAAAMVQETGEHPAVLKDNVASPGGTTIAGLQALEDAGARAAFIAAVEAATNRSIELGK